ncbi:MAG: hypothetical protein C4576_00095 [Desulfobacteraceae bacterium]|nr:MAG: hypothetical protein C4576_00095 [Desulfobacteraceae bacterium]
MMPRVISFFIALLFFLLSPMSLPANDYRERGRSSIGHQRREGYRSERIDGERKPERGEKGNEATGQIAAWIFVLANLKVGIAILARFAARVSGLRSKFGASLSRLSRFLNKHLRKIHYFLNTAAFFVAFLHFLLSSCRSSTLPEWGLVFTGAMVLMGLMVTFKMSFKWMRKAVYRVHTSPLSFVMVIGTLIAGHLIMD